MSSKFLQDFFCIFCRFCGIYFIFLIMDPISASKIFLIWMLLSITLTNCIAIKSRVCTFVFVNEPNLKVKLLPLLWCVLATIKRHPPWLWWKGLQQSTHWDQVEANVWHTTLEMKHRKYIMYYMMTFDVFQKLVLELIPCLQSQCFDFVRPHLEIKKIVAIDFYKFANGYSVTHMVDCFNVGASTIWKYLDIVCDVFTDINKIFSKYISNPIGN